MEKVIEAIELEYFIEGNKIIDRISIDVSKGRFYAVVGPNGSGKTTLLDILSGSIKPQRGRVKLMDRDIRDMTRRDIARKVAVLPQDTSVLFDFCVFDVLVMGRHPYRDAFGTLDIEDLRLVDSVIDELGLGELLSRPITQISGGERQRCFLGRVIVQDTPIVFLDEATSNLDPYYTHEILGRIKGMTARKGVTVVSVFHDLSLASMYGDYVFFMKNGRIEYKGEVREVMVPEIVEDVFSVKVKVILDEGYPHPVIIPYGR